MTDVESRLPLSGYVRRLAAIIGPKIRKTFVAPASTALPNLPAARRTNCTCCSTPELKASWITAVDRETHQRADRTITNQANVHSGVGKRAS
jgi:hypothetical protein